VNYSGNFTISGTFSPSGKVDNYGTLTINGSYNGNTPNGYLNNSGTMSVSESMSMNNPLTNSGTLTIGSSLNMNSNSSGQNQCKITVQGSVSVNAGTFTLNGGYLRTNATLTLNGNSQFVLQNRSMVSAVNMTLNSSVSGAGSKNTIKTTGQATINGNKTVSGPIEWADNDGIITNGNTTNFTNGATFVTFSNATNYVPTTPCNPEGFGTPTITDSDGDGVGDSSDAYPQDATRAYNNYFPSSTGYASLAYEDLWPSMGDFDMNDLVVDVRFNRVTNAQNKVVDLINVYHVKAVGGTFHNTFAFQLDNVNIGSVQSATGSVISAGSFITLTPSGLEAGTEKPVIVVWDDVEDVINRTGGAYFNTVNGGVTGTSDILTINVHFATPQQASAVGQPPYNHFIIRSEDRGHEIHLPGYIPTSKVDASLFNTGDDDTNPGSGKYYKSNDNLPWGIFVGESFSYPVEKKDISSVHLKFGTWAESNGSQYTDWYQNKPGYRDPVNIFGNY
jgi:LruC domain-containing protein